MEDNKTQSIFAALANRIASEEGQKRRDQFRETIDYKDYAETIDMVLELALKDYDKLTHSQIEELAVVFETAFWFGRSYEDWLRNQKQTVC